MASRTQRIFRATLRWVLRVVLALVLAYVLTPLVAVAWAATFNFLAAFTVGTAVARTVDWFRRENLLS